MAFCQFAAGAGMYDVTPIENIFLMEYLPTAPDGFLRVYLYVRMAALHPELGGSIEDVAAALRMDEDSVFNAMTYWERQGLVCRMSDRPPTYSLLSVHGGAAASNPMENDYYEYRDFNATLQTLFGPENLLSPKQFSMAYDWVNILGFTQDAVIRMVEAQLKKSRARKPETVFSRVNETADKWSRRGVRTLEDVERALLYDGQVDETATAVFKQLSISRPPTVDELQAVARWIHEWGYTKPEVIALCAETIKARNPTVAYLNSILEKRRKGAQTDVFRDAQAALKELNAFEVAPSEEQQNRYREMLEKGFEPRTIRLAAAYCRSKGQTRFEDLVWMVREWESMGLFRHDAAESYLQSRDRLVAGVRALLKRCGAERKPQLDDLKLYESWSSAFPEELIDYAAECARGMRQPMRYIEKVLSEWQKSGVKTVDEARATHEAYAQRTAAPAQNPALNYEQRTHQESDFDDLFVDLSKEYAEGGDPA